MSTYVYPDVCTCYKPWGSVTAPPLCPTHGAPARSLMWNGPICPMCGPYLGSHTCPPQYVGRHRKDDAP